ncbi:MAG: 2-keto-4-pentenoate hydratase/2-oxohepta-3-ene-1,7-dioic acid hydratase in catechol pathway [Arcobacteraceae bacterium]|jgi:2-keto-4-pentenoate hydratase/2-oxohepta-3-ene-1,7-dioic acid hydratase in catechol pathway
MNNITLHESKIIPSKVVCIGRNYVEHIQELNNETPDGMVVFNKTNSAISNTLKYFSSDTRYEGEICFLIKDKKIEGIGFGLDLTKANLQNTMKTKGLPWERAKSFDGAAVFGDFVRLEGDIKSIKMELFINSKLIQFATYDLMIYKPLEMIKEIDSFMSLEDGDIIMSGTPKGVGTYNLNDKFEGKIYIKDTLVVSTSWIVE